MGELNDECLLKEDASKKVQLPHVRGYALYHSKASVPSSLEIAD